VGSSFLIHLAVLEPFSSELKMACGRIQIASNKKTALLKQSTREVAAMLAEDPPKEEKARIRAEALIRDDQLIEAYEILMLECELLHERIKLITYSKHCPHDLVGVISTLIWASHRVDIPELLLIRKQFVAKYGKIFEENAMRNEHGMLNDRVVSKLSIEPPPAYLVQSYLEKICEQYGVDWTPSYRLTANDMIEPMKPPDGYSILPSATGTGYGPNVIHPTNLKATASTNDMTIPVVTGELIPPLVPTKGDINTYSSSGSSSTDNNYLPQPPSIPSVTTPTATVFDEPEIFVPGGGGGGKPTAPTPSVIDTKHDDTEDDNNNDADNHNDMGDSYSNLAARFSQLKK
jgi:Regulator of Vps4 activity in the MVB pathway